MTPVPQGDRPRTLLAQLLRERHWSVHDFRRRYEAVSRSLSDGRRLCIGERQAKRWLTGSVTGKPYPAACLVLEHMFGRPVEDLLAPPPADEARDPQPPITTPPTPTLLAQHPDPSPTAEAPPGAETLAPAAADAEDAFRFLVRAENTPASEIVALLWVEVRRLANAYGDHLVTLVEDLVVARKAVFRLLEGPADPARTRDLYLLGGLLCAMLAHAMRDLGHIERTLMYERTALLCADRAGHRGLHVVIGTEQAATAYWMGRYTDSVAHAQRAQQHGIHVHGSLAVLPTVQQARAQAAIGDVDHARAALTTSRTIWQRIQPDDLDEIGGLMRLSVPEQLGIVAGTAAWLPDPVEAERAAAEAVAAYDNAPYADRSHNSHAIARTDLALARIRQQELDGARQALHPVLAIAREHRVLPIRAGARRITAALSADPAYHQSPQARDLRASIGAFTRDSIVTQQELPD